MIGGEAPLHAVQSVLSVTPIALAAVGILAFLAWLNSRTTVYTITNRRVVMRFGAAIPKAINIPFGIIESAAIKPLAGDGGDIALVLKAPNKIAFPAPLAACSSLATGGPPADSARHFARTFGRWDSG